MILLNAVVLLIAASAASPIAEPAPDPVTVNPTSVFCVVVTGLVTKAKAQPQATSYCSSYLSLKPTVTTKKVQVTSYTATVVVTIPTSTSEGTRYVTEDFITTVGVPPTGTCSKAPGKRGVSTVPKPACLATYTAAPIISSACKCLSIPVSTSTATSYNTVPGISTSTQNIITTYITKTVTKTQTTTTTNSYFNIRATGASVNTLAGPDIYYPYNLQALGIPFDGTTPPSEFSLDSDCSLRLIGRYEGDIGVSAYVRDDQYLQFGEFYCNPGYTNNDCDTLKCYVSSDRKMQCIGPEGQSVSSVCYWDRGRNDFTWFVTKDVACGAEKQIFLSIE